MAVFTSVSARQAGIKSGESRRSFLAELKAAKQTLAILPPPQPDPVDQAVQRQLKLVAEQIARTRAVLNDETPYCPACERGPVEPHHRAQLLRALDALLERERILRQIPAPAQLRAPSVRQSNGARRPVVLPVGYVPDAPAPSSTPSSSLDSASL